MRLRTLSCVSSGAARKGAERCPREAGQTRNHPQRSSGDERNASAEQVKTRPPSSNSNPSTTGATVFLLDFAPDFPLGLLPISSPGVCLSIYNGGRPSAAPRQPPTAPRQPPPARGQAGRIQALCVRRSSVTSQ